jgi:hypothetical protein
MSIVQLKSTPIEARSLKSTPISAHPREERAWTGARLGCLGMTLVKAFGILVEARGEGVRHRVIR